MDIGGSWTLGGAGESSPDGPVAPLFYGCRLQPEMDGRDYWRRVGNPLCICMLCAMAEGYNDFMVILSAKVGKFHHICLPRCVIIS